MLLTYPPISPSRGLTREQRQARTRVLLAQLCDGDVPRRALEDEVIRINLVVAMQEARRFAGRGVEIADLRQVASLGLVKAVRAYDPAKATDFLSFAVPSIRGELRRWFRDKGWMVRPPRTVQELQSEVTAAHDVLVQELGRTARPSEVAARLSVDVDQVIEAVSASGCFAVDSLDLTASGNGSLSEPCHVEAGYDSVEAAVVLGPLVRRLSARDRRILELRFFRGASQAEIGEEIGVTQMQVSRLLSSIFARLREQLAEPASCPGLNPAA